MMRDHLNAAELDRLMKAGYVELRVVDGQQTFALTLKGLEAQRAMDSGKTVDDYLIEQAREDG